MASVPAIVMLSVRVGRRRVQRVGQRSLGVLNPPTHPPGLVLLKELVSGGIGGSVRKAD